MPRRPRSNGVGLPGVKGGGGFRLSKAFIAKLIRLMKYSITLMIAFQAVVNAPPRNLDTVSRIGMRLSWRNAHKSSKIGITLSLMNPHTFSSAGLSVVSHRTASAVMTKVPTVLNRSH